MSAHKPDQRPAGVLDFLALCLECGCWRLASAELARLGADPSLYGPDTRRDVEAREDRLAAAEVSE